MLFNADDYQDEAHEFAGEACEEIMYPALSLAGEAGEIANKVKKLRRDKKATHWEDLTSVEEVEDLVKEIGDCIWYCSEMASQMGISLSYVMKKNLEKLESRKARGVLGGNGDNR